MKIKGGIEMAYEDKNGKEIAQVVIDVNKVIELFDKASEDVLKPNTDILDILTALERDVIEAQPENVVKTI